MIKNFDVIKEQLKELAVVINSFKSEAVQLRLVELVFEAVESGPIERSSGDSPALAARPRRQARKKAASASAAAGSPKAKGAGRPGGKAMLDRLLAEGLFKKPKTIKQLVDHCEHNLAFKYKQSDFSGPLGRMTRDGKLKRTKNADKQYEYSEA
ncbi:MAG TPA: hypothetical protein VNO43_00165 [Candidatus Eisenbacteria bacterium]|nr:hypothetical protein [Candidatus Eisenbacteria bacterium]